MAMLKVSEAYQMYHAVMSVCYACTHIAVRRELSCAWHFFAPWNNITLELKSVHWAIFNSEVRYMIQSHNENMVFDTQLCIICSRSYLTSTQ